MKPTPTLQPRAISSLFYLLWVLWALFAWFFFLSRLPFESASFLQAFDLGRFGPGPGAGEALRRAAELLMPLGGAVWALWVTVQAGAFVRRWMGFHPDNPWSRWAWEGALGILALETFWMGTGLLGLWRGSFLIGVALIATTGLAGVAYRRAGEKDAPLSRAASDPGPLWAVRSFQGLAALSLALSALVAFLPETFYDSLAYVLAVPEQWSRAGGIVDDPDHLYSGLSLGASLWYQTGLAAFGDGAAKWMAFAVTLLSALAVGGWARGTAGRTAGWLALALVLTMPQWTQNSWAARSDGLVAFLLILAFDALARVGEGREGGEVPSRAWFLAGVLFGGAFAAKYIALAALPALAFWGWRVRGRSSARTALLFVAGALLVGGAWLVKNLAYAGNPLYPYFPEIFGGRALHEAGLARLLVENHLTNVPWLAWPPAFWRLTQPGYGESQAVGPLVMALLPLFLVVRFARPAARTWALSLLVFWGAALFATPALRFHMAGFGLLILGASWLWGSSSPRGRVALAVLTLAIGGAGIAWMGYLAAQRMDPLGVVTLRESRDQYRERTTRAPYGFLVEGARERLGPSDRLLLVGDGRAFGYPCRVTWNSVDDVAFLARSAREDRDPSALARRFRREGITHVAVNMDEAFFTAPDYGHYLLDPETWRRLDAHLRQGLTPLERRGGLCLFAVRTDPSQMPLDVEPLAYLSPPALSAKGARERKDGETERRAMAEAAAWFPQEAFFKAKGGAR